MNSAASGAVNIFFRESLDLLCIADTDGYFRKAEPGVGAHARLSPRDWNAEVP